MKLLKRISFVLLLLTVFPGFALGKVPPQDLVRTKTNINKNWGYLENNTTKLSEVKAASAWQSINLPHTWNATDVLDGKPGYRRSGSWYKKELTIDAVSEAIDYQLYFEGSNITTKVYVNGKEAGGHVGGYIGFKVPITKFIHQGKNEILVRVDNSYDPEIIPSQKNDFFIYGGIIRDLWLLKLPKNHLDKLTITTPKVSAKKASLEVQVKLEMPMPKNGWKLKAELKNPAGKLVATTSASLQKKNPTLTFKPIRNPELWDTETPNLYSLNVILMKKGKATDMLSDKVGFRWFEFKDHGPFYLNGKRLLLRGTHVHEDFAGVGAAMSNEQYRDDMKAIKKMGANFVRLVHYPQDPETYKMCDSLGILVWDELPWSRGGVGDDQWKSNTKRLFKEMIGQNRNHPSIIIWSLGNELYWLPDFKDGNNPKKINPFLNQLNDLAHKLDPSRKTAMRKYYDGAAIVDVFSPSIWAGWYSGSYKTYGKALKKYEKEYPHFLHAEYGGSSHLGRHTENPITGEGIINSDAWAESEVQTKVKNIAKIGDWSENYIVDLFDWHLRVSENDPNFVGNAQWAFRDFPTPLRPENDIPYMNQKGLVARDGTKKDAYYVFKSYWAKKPFTYIESHTWKLRQGPEGKSRTISVYSNCPEVEFFFNGKSLGKKKKDLQKFPASGLTWEVQFQKGDNQLKAIGYPEKGTSVSDTLSVKYRYEKNGAAQALKLSSKKLKNGHYLVTATAVDENGLRCLDYQKKVYFQCLEGGKLLEDQGTYTGSNRIAMANGKASIEVIPNQGKKKIVFTVLNQSFKGTFLEIPLE